MPLLNHLSIQQSHILDTLTLPELYSALRGHPVPLCMGYSSPVSWTSPFVYQDNDPL